MCYARNEHTHTPPVLYLAKFKSDRRIVYFRLLLFFSFFLFCTLFAEKNACNLKLVDSMSRCFFIIIYFYSLRCTYRSISVSVCVSMQVCGALRDVNIYNNFSIINSLILDVAHTMLCIMCILQRETNAKETEQKALRVNTRTQ